MRIFLVLLLTVLTMGCTKHKIVEVITEAPQYADNQVVVGFKDNTPVNRKVDLRESYEAEVLNTIEQSNAEIWHIEIMSVMDAVAGIKQSLYVKYAEPNYKGEPH